MNQPAAPAAAPRSEPSLEGDGVGGERLPVAIDRVLALRRGLLLRVAGMLTLYATVVVALAWVALAPGNAIQSALGRSGISLALAREIAFGLVLLATLGAGALLHRTFASPLAELAQSVPGSSWMPIQSRAIGDYAQLRAREHSLGGELKQLRAEKQKLAGEVDLLGEHQKSANATLAIAIGLTHDALVLTDAGGRIRDVSPPALELLHYNRADVLGKPFAQVVALFEPASPDSATPLPDMAARTMERRANVPQLQQALLKNGAGESLNVLAGASAVIGHAGEVIGAIVRIELYGAVAASQRATEAARGRSAGPGEDPATGLANAETFDKRLEMLVNIARSQQARHALLFLAIDNFDEVCATHTHWAGEELLWQVAQLLRGAGESAEPFRVSSLHFGVLMPFASPESALATAEKLRTAVETREFKTGEHKFEARISVGIVAVGPESEGPKVLLGLANQALGQARAQGGNRVQLLAAGQAVDARRKDDRQWVSWLHRSMRQGRAHIISQSIEPLARDVPPLPLLEVLLRIEDEDGVWITPGAFLPSVVRHNLTAQLDLWMLRRLLQVLGDQPQLLETHHGVNLNIARSSITEGDFAEKVVEVLNESPAPAGKLCFEVEAMVAINHPSDFARFVNTVRPIGARFAIDGAKAAMGLNALVSLPVDYVKIHQALIHSCVANPLDQAYVEWINHAVHKLERRTIATGVENQQTLEVLKRIGVDYAQGVHINKLGPLMA